MSSPAIGSPAYNNESIGWELMTADLVTVIIALVLVIGRLYTKYFITKSPGWEDCSSVLALLLAIARVVGDSLGVYRYDLGRHINIFPESDLNPLVLLVAVDGLLYIVAITFAKLAILIFLYRIFKVIPKFRYTSWAIGAIMTVWALVTVLLICFACRPLAATFNFKLRYAPTTVCIVFAPDVENIFGFCNIFVDFMLLLMPIPLLWTLHMTRAKKIGVSIVFANGAVICAIAIVRQYILYTSPDATDPAWDIVRIKIWMTIEVNLAITCACLPVLTPLFRKLPLLVPFLPSNLSGGPTALEHASWPRILTGPHRHNSHDVEKGAQRPKAPWREPDEASESGESTLSMYHHQQQQQESPVTLDRVAVREERLGEDGAWRGVAL